jgi:hypothetical protein
VFSEPPISFSLEQTPVCHESREVRLQPQLVGLEEVRGQPMHQHRVGVPSLEGSRVRCGVARLDQRAVVPSAGPRATLSFLTENDRN